MLDMSTSAFTVRPATSQDAADGQHRFPGMQPDRWREGGNRRSLALLDADGTVVGHCRGIDNTIHPASRVLVLEIAPELHGTPAEDALLQAQVEVSALPLHAKPQEKDEALRALLERAGGVLVQLMPPWRFLVGPELRTWADRVLAEDPPRPGARIVPAAEVDPAALRRLETEHYIAQHASWSPAARPEVLTAEFAEDHDALAAGTWSREHSRAILSADGDLLAAALLWGGFGTTENPATGEDAPELVHLSDPSNGAGAFALKRRAIAAVVTSAPDGVELCIDSHLSLRAEYAAITAIPGRVDTAWTAIVAVPVPGGPAPIPLDPALIPDEAAWARAFA